MSVTEHQNANAELLTITDVIEAARANLPAELWDYLSGGAESETTLRRNRAAFDRIALRPRIMRDVSDRETSVTVLGQELSLPVMLAPVGSIGQYHPDGALACARVARSHGTLAFVSTVAEPGLARIRESYDGPLVFQLYVRGGLAGAKVDIERAAEAGCIAICLTADLRAPGHRERNIRNHYGGRHGAGHQSGDVLSSLFESNEALTWNEFDALRAMTNLPLILKGVSCPEDALLALDHGADVIYVSNHGGRQLDHMPASLDVLSSVIDAVGRRADVIVDSGFVRGSDVVKACALGAKAVLIGKLMGWGLAADGEAGLSTVLDLLGYEIRDLLAHLGVKSVAALSRDVLAGTYQPPASEWVGFAQG